MYPFGRFRNGIIIKWCWISFMVRSEKHTVWSTRLAFKSWRSTAERTMSCCSCRKFSSNLCSFPVLADDTLLNTRGFTRRSVWWHVMTSWWLNHPFENNASQIGSFPRVGVKIKQKMIPPVHRLTSFISLTTFCKIFLEIRKILQEKLCTCWLAANSKGCYAFADLTS